MLGRGQCGYLWELGIFRGIIIRRDRACPCPCSGGPCTRPKHIKKGSVMSQAKALVIVESPTKAKTIKKFLGADFVVEASGGHIMDLPAGNMGVDVEHDFSPRYVVIPTRKKVVAQLERAAKDKEYVYLAADPDREGEAICWHLQQNLHTAAQIFRVIFHEITEGKVKAAFAHPGAVDINRVEAQQARRILDRLVGYNLSPLLWKKISRGLSAGRVQSVAVRLIVEREREITQFRPEEYWEVEALLKKYSSGKPFSAGLYKISGQEAKINNQKQADEILLNARKERFVVTDVQQKEKKRNPQAPYTTSKLQQEAFNRLRFTADRTMRIAQQLYEGIELGEKGSVGLITYMRTDSVKVSQDAQEACREYIKAHFGERFIPRYPLQYKSGKGAQQAHEAIRPALPLQEPRAVKQYLSPEQYKLYVLIWNKFVSSQMPAALFEVRTALVQAGDLLFRAVGSTLKFAGFLKALDDGTDNHEEEHKQILPALSIGEELKLVKLDARQHWTQPPPRFSDASLVKTLEEKGIGRPSTYVPIIRTIILRDYVRRQKGYFLPTELGITVNDLLTKYFSRILDYKFTAHLEEELDEVEEGKLKWREVVRVFYKPLIKELVVAQKQIKKEAIPTDEVCEQCGRPMVIKWGRRGRFLSCAGFPKCKNARSITTNVRCPQPDCGGLLVERRTRYGRMFYGCTNYPKCTYTANKLPEETVVNG